MRWFKSRGRRRWKLTLPLASLVVAAAGPIVASPIAARPVVAAGSTAVGRQEDTGTDLLLAVVINGHAISMIGDFKQRDGRLYVTPDELNALGFRPYRYDNKTNNAADVPLGRLKGVSFRLDEHTQTIYFTARSSALKPTILGTEGVDEARSLPVESGLGAAANYNIVGTMQGGETVAEGLLDARIFTPFGVATSSFLGTAGAQYSPTPVLRLDSTYSYSDPDTLRRYHLGDVISGGLSWTRPVRLGGVQVTTDFSIRPDLVTFPVPTISGEVAVPSSVDVLVNGVQFLSRDVPPGPFEIRQLPIVTGGGDISVVVRDAVGQQTTQTLPVYASGLLLASGLTAFSAEAGMVRLNYGLLSNDYQAPAGSFSYRHGLLNWLTLEGHGEGNGPAAAYEGLRTSAGGMAGGGPAFTIGRLGVISLAAAGSHFAGRSGSLVSASYERVTQRFSFTGSIQATAGRFGDIASAAGDPVPTLQTRASIGLPLGKLGSFGVAYVGQRRPPIPLQTSGIDQPNADVVSGLDIPALALATSTKLVSATYSRQLFHQRAYFYATGFRDFANPLGSGLMAGITIPLGGRSSAGGSFGGGAGTSTATVQASQAAGDVGDIGWQLQDDTGTIPRQLATGEYRTPWGLVDAGIDWIDGQSAFRGSLQGAVAVAGGGLFASNTINDSFAVVDTDGFRNIEVLQENRPIGRTDAAGLLFVPDLRSFQANRLAIDPNDVSVDADVDRTMRLVRPQDHSGVIVHFPVHSSHGALVRLVDASGVPLAVGGSARLAGSPDTSEVMIGYDGEAFVTGLHPHDKLTVLTAAGQRCGATFDYKPVAGKLPEIGPLTCKQALP